MINLKSIIVKITDQPGEPAGDENVQRFETSKSNLYLENPGGQSVLTRLTDLNPLRTFVRRKQQSLCKHVSLEDNHGHKGQREKKKRELPTSQREAGSENKSMLSSKKLLTCFSFYSWRTDILS